MVNGGYILVFIFIFLKIYLVFEFFIGSNLSILYILLYYTEILMFVLTYTYLILH